MSNKIISTVYACLIGMFTLSSASSFAITSGCPDTGAYPMNGCSLPGQTADGSFPFFYQNVSVDYTQKKNSDDFRLKAKFLKGSLDSFLSVDPEDVLDITKTKYQFDAKVTGGDARGKLKITGKIDQLDFRGTLMTADLDGNWGADGTLIGFDTKNIKCSDAINAYLGGGGCTTDEFVYFNLLEAIGPDAGARKIKTAGIAVTSLTSMTTIPLPAAAWLFGSGLLALIGMERHSHRVQG
jgi:hypothetical protein